jgi:hypothetical protein
MRFGGNFAPVLMVLAWATIVSSLAPVCLGEGPSAKEPSADLIVHKMMVANAQRSELLHAFTGKRSYRVEYHGFPGGREAEMQVEATYVSPDQKSFRIISESGSKILINHVLMKLLESEKDYLQESNRRASELSPRNYKFSFAGIDHGADGDCYVLSVTPLEKTTFLYRGKIWVDTHDYAVARIEGEPAKNPSMWISHTEINHRYKKFGEFWLPVSNESVTQVRLGGKAVLTIDYSDYQISTANRSAGAAQGTDNAPVLPSPNSVTADPH